MIGVLAGEREDGPRGAALALGGRLSRDAGGHVEARCWCSRPALTISEDLLDGFVVTLRGLLEGGPRPA